MFVKDEHFKFSDISLVKTVDCRFLPLFSLYFASIKFREKSLAIFPNFKEKVELKCIKFCDFSIL